MILILQGDVGLKFEFTLELSCIVQDFGSVTGGLSLELQNLQPFLINTINPQFSFITSHKVNESQFSFPSCCDVLRLYKVKSRAN